MDAIPESTLISPSGVEAIITVLDRAYRGYRRHVEEDTFGKLLYGAGRPTGESMISFTTRFQAELTKFEVQEAAPLPEKTRVRLLLRKRNLS